MELSGGERLAHPRRARKPEFKQERYPPLDGASCSHRVADDHPFGGVRCTTSLSGSVKTSTPQGIETARELMARKSGFKNGS